MNESLRSRILAVLCLSALCGILVACLWPFHAPKNEVTWLGNENGLQFGHHGTVLSSGSLKLRNSHDITSATIEIWLQPGLTNDSNTFLAFYSPLILQQFSLHQSDSDLVLQGGAADRQHHSRPARLYVDEVFREGKPVFITISLNAQATTVYVDGVLAKASPALTPSDWTFTGQLVVGDSPVGPDSWPGKLRGLAIYNRQLTAPQIIHSYHDWTEHGRPDFSVDQDIVALYLFDEHTGGVAHNQVTSGVDLYIPERYLIVDQTLLESPWHEFYVGWSYWKNVIINIVGFIPFGFLVCAYFSSVRHLKRAVLVTIILGGSLSLTVEILQAYLPTRQSGLTDVITNTLGTCVGAALFRWNHTQSLYRAGLNHFHLTKLYDE